MVRGLVLSTLLVGVWAQAGGGGRPTPNPFESGAGVGIDEWALKQKSAPLNLILTSNLSAKLGPCGCSTNPKGGVDRRHNFIQSQKSLKGGTLILDAGNSLFASRNLDTSLLTKQKARAQKISEAQKSLGVEVQNVGVLDLAAGVDFAKSLAKSSGLKMIASNLRTTSGQAPFETFHVREVPGLGKVLVIGVTLLPEGGLMGLTVLDPVAVVKDLIKSQSPQFTVVLSDLGQSEDMSLMNKIKSPMLVVGARDLNAIDIPLHAGEGILIQPGIQGQQVGLFRIVAGEGFAAWRNLTQERSLSQRWKQLESEYKYLREQPASDDKTRALERIQDTFEELSKYAQSDLKKSWPYAYELFDMDERYAQKNSFTKLALEDQ